MQKVVRPLAGVIFLLILWQGASGAKAFAGQDWAHGHSAQLLLFLAISIAPITIKAEFPKETRVVPHASALSIMSIITWSVGTYLMEGGGSGDWGWLHVPLALAMSGHCFALILLARPEAAMSEEEKKTEEWSY